MNLVFFGSSDWSLIILEKLLKYRILVVTSPDKPAGRGLKPFSNTVKSFCVKNSIQFVEDDDWGKVRSEILSFSPSPDFFIVASYGRIIPREVLELLCEERRLNVHPSLVPRWRGPAPIQWAILSGDRVTGVSIISVVEKTDSGRIFFQKEESIHQSDDAYTLGKRLFSIAAEVLEDVMNQIIDGRITPRDQSDEGVVWARLIKKEDGFFSFYEPAEYIHRKMRAFSMWPKIFTRINGEIVKIHKTELPEDLSVDSYKAGQVYRIDERGIWVVCGCENRKPNGKVPNVIILTALQRQGRKVLSGKDFANGMRIKVGDSLI